MIKNIAIIGSDQGLNDSIPLAQELGRELAKTGVRILIGAGGRAQGLPLHAAIAAKNEGAVIFGVSPWEDVNDHKKRQLYQTEVYDFIMYTGFGIKGRNVVLIRNADAVVAVGGAMGTLNEFSIAFDDGKIIGVLEGSGGTSDMIKKIAPLGRDKGAVMVYSRNPKVLVEKVMKLIKKRYKD